MPAKPGYAVSRVNIVSPPIHPIRLRQRIRATAAEAARLLGVEQSPVSNVERLISAGGGLLALFLLMRCETELLGASGAALVVASMGASAVLLYAVPHGALSQPWAVIAGHLVSALAGVTAAKLISDPALAAAIAVGGAILGMHYLRAIHPPGGASALTAVVGGQQVHDLGYAFVLTPVLINAVIMVALAIVINWAFAWRRYPVALRPHQPAGRTPTPEARELTHADFTAALARIGTFVDISEDEFLRLRELMREAEAGRRIKAEDIRLGAYYSNGATGPDWCVRRIVDEEPSGAKRVIWRTIAGAGRDETGLATREAFATWAACEVVRAETTWVRRQN